MRFTYAQTGLKTKHNHLDLLILILFSLCPYPQAHAAAGLGGVVQGVLNYPGFKSGLLGSIDDMDDPAGNPYPPYFPTLAFPEVDDSVHTPGIPGVTVHLKNTATNAISTSIVTDSKGIFVFPSQPAGTYALCWTTGMPGLAPGCSNDPNNSFGYATFSTLDHASNRWVANLGSSYLIDWSALDNAANGILAFEGYVSAPEHVAPYQPNLNTACAHSDPFFNQDQTATVQLLNSAGFIVASVKANSLGRYLITTTAPATTTSYKLKASCGLSTVSVSVSANGSNRLYQDLSLPNNSPPKISSLFADNGSNTTALAGAPLGATVHAIVQALDLDGDALRYTWKATAGTIVASGNTAQWTLPATGKGLHFLYVDVDDQRAGHIFSRIAISTDTGFVAAPAQVVSPVQPADHYTESDRFLTYRGIDNQKTACQYYKAIGAVTGCTSTGGLTGGITFQQWLAKYGLTAPPSPYTPTPALNSGEYHAQFRNVADLNLIRNHHGRNAGPDTNGKSRVAYYVCNHAKPTSAIPDVNLVACVSMEYSVTLGQNNGQPFTKFLTFGPTGALIPSVNLDGRGEKYTPGNCVPCHGGDNYFQHFPDHGAGSHDGNIGAYFIPFDLDNFQYDAPYTRAAQENSVRNLNLGQKVGDMATSAAKELIAGWYPGNAGLQHRGFLPKGWDPTKTPNVPVLGHPDPTSNNVISTFNGSDLYLKVVKPSCRGCHLSMGAPLGLDFHSYDYDGVNSGDFIGGHAIIPRTGLNDLHTYYVTCAKYHDGLPTYNALEDLNSPAKTMPNAIQTFNRYWKDSVQTGLMQTYLNERNIQQNLPNGGAITCEAPGH